MDRRKSSLMLVIAALLCVAALLAIVLGGVFSTRATTNKLDRSAARNECARQVSADQDEAFRHNLAAILDDLYRHDTSGVQKTLKVMVNAPNLADLVNAKCPQPIARALK